jgi:hypothetical protein
LVKKSPQAKRIIVVAHAKLADAATVEGLVRGIS